MHDDTVTKRLIDKVNWFGGAGVLSDSSRVDLGQGDLRRHCA
jgi:hypothetical protein